MTSSSATRRQTRQRTVTADGQKHLHAQNPAVAILLTYKRWRVRDGIQVQAVVNLVRDRIVPHYRTLDPTVRLGLEQIDGSRAVLATQRWLDRGRRDRTIQGPTFDVWLEAYQPLLEEWDRLVEFETEWESTELI